MSSPRASLTDGPIGTQLWRLSGPMLIGIVSVMLFNVVDTYFVARLGKTALAAISLTFPVVTFIGSLTLGLGIGTTSVLARAIGRGEEDTVRRLTTDALLLSVIVVAVLASIGWLTTEPLFRLLGAHDETLPLVKDYMEIWYLGIVFLVVPMVGNAAIRATGDTKTPAVVMIVAGVANAVLDPILIFGLGPIPALEVKGAAIATVLGRAITFVVALWVLLVREKMVARISTSVAVVVRSFKQILAVGLPAATTNVVVPLSVGVLTGIIARHGDAAVAAFGAGSRVEMLALMPVMAVGAGLGPFVGQNFGAGRMDRIGDALGLSWRFAFGWSVVSIATLFALAQPLARIFSEDADVIALLALFLMVTPFGHGFQGLFVVGSSTFNAAGQPVRAAILSILRAPVLVIPIALLGERWFGVGGIFGAVAVSNVIVGCLSVVWVRLMLRDANGVRVPVPERA